MVKPKKSSKKNANKIRAQRYGKDDMSLSLFPGLQDPELKDRLEKFIPKLGDYQSPEEAIEAFLTENEDLRPPDEPEKEYNFDLVIKEIEKLSPESLKKWEKLLDLASKFARLAPWKRFFETEIYGVQDPISGVRGYCSIMGNRGEHYALAVYKGESGLADFIHLETNFDFQGPSPYYFLLHQSEIQLSFHKKIELQQPDLVLYQKLKYRPQQADMWPEFRDYTPGFLPWFINESQQDFMIQILEQSLILIPQLANLLHDRTAFIDEYEGFNPKGKILCRIPETINTETRWKNVWQPLLANQKKKPQFQLDEKIQKNLGVLKNLQCELKGVWELGVFFIEDIFQTSTERPYFGRLAMLIDRTTKYILMAELLDINRPYMDLNAKLIQVVKKIMVVPKTLVVPSEELMNAMAPFTTEFMITLKFSEKIKALIDAIPSFPNIIVA